MATLTVINGALQKENDTLREVCGTTALSQYAACHIGLVSGSAGAKFSAGKDHRRGCSVHSMVTSGWSTPSPAVSAFQRAANGDGAYAHHMYMAGLQDHQMCQPRSSCAVSNSCMSVLADRIEWRQRG